jgi:modulator of FtsH protease
MMQPNVIIANSRKLDDSSLKVLKSTYLLLAATMIPTFFGSILGIYSSGFIMKSPIMSSLLMLGAVIGLQFAIQKNRNSGLGIILLLLMTFILGWWLGPMLNVALSLRNGASLISLAAIGTGSILAAMSFIAITTKRDFSFMGKFLFVGMMVLLVMMIANMFLQLPALSLTLSALVVIVFSLFLLHDVSRIINGGETNYIIAATGVYMSLFNIFVNLLHLLIAFAGNRE